ncbi:hypothetical protein [Hymenobacter crusticola]|uniref:DUF4168 domain-containing protein n=1 Tax=Hymenobacter crusticola TaxID=1770526 RepID=A0A243WAU3_9BACT|nr:hypothetical protein [Hymenobacter crusticola]OUJ72675.1 hypothetical protein BXP70_17345 [Hymenobacter crusticola]
MNNKFVTAALVFAATAFGANAQQAPGSTVMPQDKTQSSPRLNPVQARAKRLSDQMARDLRLNGYQTTKLRAINEDKVAKMAAIEQKYASNPKLVDEQCQGVCRERDQELRNVLSSAQYSSYYDSRATFYKFDRDYATKNAGAMMVKSVQNPLPASSKGSILSQGRNTQAASTSDK